MGLTLVHSNQGEGLGVLLVSKKWPNYTLAMDMYETDLADGTRSTKYQLDARQLDNDPTDEVSSVENSAMMLKQPPAGVENNHSNYSTMVMMQGIRDNVYAYVPRGLYGIA